MPIFEYECLECNTVNEVLTRRGAKAPPCPECGSSKVRKAFSVFAVSSPACPSERKCESSGPRGGCPMSSQCRIGA